MKRPKKRKNRRANRALSQAEMQRVTTDGPRPPMTPASGYESKTGFRQPRKRYDEVCFTCRNARVVTNIVTGAEESCQRCRG